eukprot:gene4812-6741_t
MSTSYHSNAAISITRKTPPRTTLLCYFCYFWPNNEILYEENQIVDNESLPVRPITEILTQNPIDRILQRPVCQLLITTEIANNDSNPLLNKVSIIANNTNTEKQFIAGQTFPKFGFNPIDDINTSTFKNSCCDCPSSSFNLRIGPNYKKNKLKAPSDTALYDFMGGDFVQCANRLDDFGSKVNFPSEWLKDSRSKLPVPQIMIINTQLPLDFSPSLFQQPTDGPGWSLVLYFKISQKMLDYLDNLSSAPGGVKLFVNYCEYIKSQKTGNKDVKSQNNNNSNKSSSQWDGRFKLSIRCENIEKFNLPSFISSYNAKPIIIRNTGTMIRSSDGSYMEMDINVHRFGSVPKKALEVLFNRFDQMVISMGFCIESREENEMPEILFGTATLHQPTHTMAYKWSN